jgi:nitrogen fixation/metabolism regulation signal transduction histidine kinase
MAREAERQAELQRDFLTSAAVLVAVNLLLAFGAIGLFVRMGPVIDDILRMNVVSLEAAHEMLAVLAGAGEPLDEQERLRFERALDLATTNVTEPEEASMVIQISATRERAYEADREAVNQIVHQLDALVRVNYDAMREVDAEARRLGNAGAWSAVFLAFFSFLLSLGVVSRLRRRVIAPMVEMYEVLEAVRRGDRYRRCRANEGPIEIKRLASSINLLLDGGLTDAPIETSSSSGDALRTALAMLLEERAVPTVVVDAQGNIVATNSPALDALNAPGGPDLRQSIARLPEIPPEDNTPAQDVPFEAIALSGHDGWLLSLR